MRLDYNSPIVLTYSIICIVIFYIDHFLGTNVTQYFTLNGDFNATSPASWFSLVSYSFGHASTEHLWGNLSFLLLLGPFIEEKHTSFDLFMMTFFTVILTAILHIAFFDAGLMGASGVVFMFIALSSFANAKPGTIPLTFILIAVLFIGKEVVASMKTDNVSQFAHIVGGIIGTIFGFWKSKYENRPSTIRIEEVNNN